MRKTVTASNVHHQPVAQAASAPNPTPAWVAMAEGTPSYRPTPAGMQGAVLVGFLNQTISVSYLIIVGVIIGSGVLMLIVGMAAGFGSQRTCRYEETAVAPPSNIAGDKRYLKYEPGKPWTNYRLPRDVVPVHYILDLKPYFYGENESWFSGYVCIEAQVLAPTRYVIIHAADITVSSVSVRYLPDQPGGEKTTARIGNPEIADTFYFDQFQYFVIELTSDLLPNRSISIEMTFNGSLANPFEGFYKKLFRVPGTNEKLFAIMTHFEPVAARKAFPCFDEPNMKAFFTITIRHKPTVVALSNMPLGTKEIVGSPDGLTTVSRFSKTSVPMSTYLVAMVVGPYSASNCRQTDFDLPVCVVVPPHLLLQTDFALGVAVKGIEWLQSFFAFNYSLPKVDLIVYPELRPNAMENWGLVAFREEALMISTESTENDKDTVTSFVMHELAHFWYGNLVTMDWWDELWLNEGFASYMEFPSSWSLGRLNNGDEYIDMLKAITMDSTESTRPIRALNVRTRNDISAAFDSVTYQKGSSIIRMLVGAIGMDNFRAGIQKYMKKFQFKNARTSDLWESMSHFSTMDIKSVMDTWVEQKGFPLVKVEVDEGERQLILHQESFALPQWTCSGMVQPVPLTSRWNIPIVYRLPNAANTSTVWFPPDVQQLAITFSQSDVSLDETKLNAGQAAYIRVNYPLKTWIKFASKLRTNILSFSPVDRAGLVDDVMELSMAGHVPYSVAFKVVQFLVDETHPIVWDAFNGHILFLRHMLDDSPQFGLFENFVLGIIRSARIQTLSSEMSYVAKKQTLSSLAELSLIFQKPEEIACYSGYFKKQTWRNPANIDLRRAVLVAYVLSNDTEAALQELYAIARQSNVKQVKRSVQYAITRTQQRWLLIKELEKVFSGEISSAEFLSLASYACNSPRNRQLVWNWVRENYDKVKPLFASSTRNLMRWLFDIPYFFNTKTQFDELESFVKAMGDLGAGVRLKNLAIERVRLNIYWREKLRKNAESALVDNADLISTRFNKPVIC